jgi:hypothetical protein
MQSDLKVQPTRIVGLPNSDFRLPILDFKRGKTVENMRVDKKGSLKENQLQKRELRRQNSELRRNLDGECVGMAR